MKSNVNIFDGRDLIIGTQHKKEKVIAPLLEKVLKVNCIIPEHFDTDIFGTFSGEVERKHDPLTTAREKCLHVMKLYNCDLAVASEGSFGPHPEMYFIPADDEIIVLIDSKNDLEIKARHLSIDTNFSGKAIGSKSELLTFAKSVLFPSHGLIIRKAKDDHSEVVKGIVDEETLVKVYSQFLANHGTVFVETDMRAMYNPTRMINIEKATHKLAEIASSICPNCETPGFGVHSLKPGLPCNLCGLPTRSTLSYIYKCQRCTFVEEKKYPNKKLQEDPMYCDNCNP